MLKFKIKTFLSYSSKDFEIASQFYSVLTDFPLLNNFMAPGDIPAGLKGNDFILKQIKECDIFIIIGTENYHLSNFTEQEIGAAWAFDKKILPLAMGGKTEFIKGIASDFQIKTFPTFYGDSMAGIALDIYSQSMGEESDLLNFLIDNELKICSNYARANAIYALVKKLTDKLNENQTRSILDAFLLNDQIRGSHKWGSSVSQFFNKQKDMLDLSVYDEYEKLLKNIYS